MHYHDINICSCLTEAVLIEDVGSPETLAFLEKKFDEFNRLYFDGKLTPVPIKWAKSRRMTAWVNFRSTTPAGTKMKNYVEGSATIAFSTFWKRSQDDLIPILLHEMLHLWFPQVENDCFESHGAKFEKKRREIEAKSGIAIPMTEADNAELANEVTTNYVILRRGPRHYTSDSRAASYAVFGPSITKLTKQPEIAARFARTTDEQVELRVVKSKLWTEKCAKAQHARKVNYKTSFWYCSKEALDDLLANSTVFWKIVDIGL